MKKKIYSNALFCLNLIAYLRHGDHLNEPWNKVQSICRDVPVPFVATASEVSIRDDQMNSNDPLMQESLHLAAEPCFLYCNQVGSDLPTRHYVIDAPLPLLSKIKQREFYTRTFVFVILVFTF